VKVEHISGAISVHLCGEPIEKLKSILGLKDEYTAPKGSLIVLVSEKGVIIKLEVFIKKEAKKNG